MARQIAVQDPQDEQLNDLLRLAQLQKMLSDPGQEQQKIDQTDHTARMTAAIHLLGLQQEAKNQAEQRRLQQLGIDETAHTREAGVKLNLLGDLLRNPNPDPAIVETVGGLVPEFGVAQQHHKEQALATEIAKVGPILGAVKDPEQRKLIMGQLSPEAQTHFGQVELPPTVPTDSTGTKIGQRVGWLANHPEDVFTPKGIYDFGSRMGQNMVRNNQPLIKDILAAFQAATQPTQ